MLRAHSPRGGGGGAQELLSLEAELQALQQEPRDARAQDGDAGTRILRRPAARNAEEDRGLSHRRDAAQWHGGRPTA